MNEQDQATVEAFKAGEKFAETHADRYLQNPYQYGTKPYEDWEAGFQAKRDAIEGACKHDFSRDGSSGMIVYYTCRKCGFGYDKDVS